MLMEITPMSLNAHEELYGGGLAEFSLYCLGYWLQQNVDKADNKDYIKLKGAYEQARNLEVIGD